MAIITATMSLPFRMGTATTFLVWYSVSSSTKSLKWGLCGAEEERTWGGDFLIAVNFSELAPVTASRLNFDKGAESLHKRCKQRAFHYVHALRPLATALQLLLLLSGRGHPSRLARGETVEERLINCREGAGLWWRWVLLWVTPCIAMMSCAADSLVWPPYGFKLVENIFFPFFLLS